ncbi:MAG: ParB/RepB/Spo0J family partition protein [Nitrososphaerales archaeon]
MEEDIRLNLIEDNPFNSRLVYDRKELHNLAASLNQNGLLSPISVRKHEEKYQLVFGHRRVRAARLNAWETIRANVKQYSDEEMLKESIVENLDRKDLSDFEKALSIRKMHELFGKSYAEIGKLLGYSTEHVCNHLRMAHLFEDDMIKNDSRLRSQLHQITEHHARILLRIEDPATRKQVLNVVCSENTSVRDLERVVHRLRSWFDLSSENQPDNASGNDFPETTDFFPRDDRGSKDVREIQDVLKNVCTVNRTRDFDTFLDLHSFDEGFTFYDDVPPYQRLHSQDVIEKKRNWFFSIAPHLTIEMNSLQIQFFGKVALATFYVEYRDRASERTVKMISRASVLLNRIKGKWKVVHEHWSALQNEKEIVGLI